MPRIKQKQDVYANADFQKEVFVAMIRSGITDCSIRKLADLTGVGQSCLNTNLRHKPENLTVATLRKIVKAIKPDIRSVLVLLGYDGKDIKKFVEEC